MSNFAIFTDSSCDLTQELADQLELHVLPLSVNTPRGEFSNYLDGREIDFSTFYARLRGGDMCTTSAVNSDAFRRAMEPLLTAGTDILYIGFSSGLSGTYSAGETAAAELREKYPERKIYTVDTLAASLGQGMLVYLAAQKKRTGAGIDEVRDYLEENKLHLCHWFTVDDLQFLKRGGRISGAVAIIGTMLKIKPVLHVDDEGHLINMEKARGRRASLNMLVDHMEATAVNAASQTVFISHGDCLEDAEYVAERVKQRLGVKDVIINYVGPVIGAHSGPGTVALFFLGTKR